MTSNVIPLIFDGPEEGTDPDLFAPSRDDVPTSRRCWKCLQPVVRTDETCPSCGVTLRTYSEGVIDGRLEGMLEGAAAVLGAFRDALIAAGMSDVEAAQRTHRLQRASGVVR